MTGEEILNAAYPEDVFGELWDGVRPTYRQLAKEFHPDAGGDEAVFKKLAELYKLAAIAHQRDEWGKRVTTTAVLITSRRHAYAVTRLRYQGHLANVYDATYTDPDGMQQNATLKVVRDPKDGPKLAREATTLRTLLKTDAEFFDLISLYLPAYIEAFGLKQENKRRQAIAFRSEYPVVSLEDVQLTYPNGVHPKDSAWMMRRIFMALGFTHASGWVHRAVNKRHILIQPAEHGLMLVDWTAATQEPWDPKIAGQDVADGIRSLQDITAMDKAPRRYIRFIEGCLRAPHRLPDAWTLKDEYDELIEELWGPRKFRPFVMPIR